MTTYIINHRPRAGRTPWFVYRVHGDDERAQVAGFTTRNSAEAFVQSKHVNAWTQLDARTDGRGRMV